MFDLFGSGARARVKALEEALVVERERTEKLTAQLIAMTDAKAYRVLVPATPIERAEAAPKVRVDRPGQHRNHNASIHAAREAARRQES